MKVRNIRFVEDDNLIRWELDEKAFKIEFPKLYAKYKQDPEESIDNLFAFEGEPLSKVVKTLPCIQIELENGDDQIISNKNLLDIYPWLWVDHYNILCEHNFVYCIIQIAAGQAGTLGIWDTKKNDWCFDHSDEGFCVVDINYDENKDEFLGSTEMVIPFSRQIEVPNFIVTSERKYKEVSLSLFKKLKNLYITKRNKSIV